MKNKRILFISAIYCLSFLNIYCKDISKDNVILFLFKENKTTFIYKSPNKDSIIAKISDKSEIDKLYAFNVLEIEGGMIKVIAWNTANNKKIKGWISIFETAIYGRTRTEKGIYELYDKPSYNSKKTILESDWDCYKYRGGKYMKIRCNIDANFKVLDIHGEWLKVEIIVKGRIYRKWLPSEYQCPNVYGGCT